MRSHSRFLALMGLAISFSAPCLGATLSGTVKGPDGTPLPGVFVEAQNSKTKMSFIVLSDSHGHYKVDKLPGGDYRVQVKATGFRGDPKSGVALSDEQNAAMDFALMAAPVRWNELSIYQAKKLWPEDKAKQTIFTKCFICHGFQTRMASVRRDAEGWKDRVQFMRDAMHFSLSYRISDQDAAEVAAYLNKLYGSEDPDFPKSPDGTAGIQATRCRPFSSEAMNIAYVEYDMPGPSRMPFSAAPAKDGSVWIPNFGIGNKITRLNPKTGGDAGFSRAQRGHGGGALRGRCAGRLGVADRASVRQAGAMGSQDTKDHGISGCLSRRGWKAGKTAARGTRCALIPRAWCGPAAIR